MGLVSQHEDAPLWAGWEASEHGTLTWRAYVSCWCADWWVASIGEDELAGRFAAAEEAMAAVDEHTDG